LGAQAQYFSAPLAFFALHFARTLTFWAYALSRFSSQ
jgi:hypothetical protein